MIKMEIKLHHLDMPKYYSSPQIKVPVIAINSLKSLKIIIWIIKNLKESYLHLVIKAFHYKVEQIKKVKKIHKLTLRINKNTKITAHILSINLIKSINKIINKVKMLQLNWNICRKPKWYKKKLNNSLEKPKKNKNF